eukprot:454019-Prorocentrum_minimum.AAC.1
MTFATRCGVDSAAAEVDSRVLGGGFTGTPGAHRVRDHVRCLLAGVVHQRPLGVHLRGAAHRDHPRQVAVHRVPRHRPGVHPPAAPRQHLWGVKMGSTWSLEGV